MTSFMTTTRRQAMCLCSSLRSSQRSFFSSLGGRRLRSMPRSSLITTANQAKPPPTPAPARECSRSLFSERAAYPRLNHPEGTRRAERDVVCKRKQAGVDRPLDLYTDFHVQRDVFSVALAA